MFFSLERIGFPLAIIEGMGRHLLLKIAGRNFLTPTFAFAIGAGFMFGAFFLKSQPFSPIAVLLGALIGLASVSLLGCVYHTIASLAGAALVVPTIVIVKCVYLLLTGVSFNSPWHKIFDMTSDGIKVALAIHITWIIAVPFGYLLRRLGTKAMRFARTPTTTERV